jgi:hypothetical protein
VLSSHYYGIQALIKMMLKIWNQKTVFTHSFRSERYVWAGFSWSAFLFSAFWAFSEGLAAIGYRLIAVDLGVAMLIHIYEMTRGGLWGVLAAAILIAKHVACGCYASRWLVRDLKGRGYSCVG